jgi:hypothetical protein
VSAFHTEKVLILPENGTCEQQATAPNSSPWGRWQAIVRTGSR